jgi:hypothetical protein
MNGVTLLFGMHFSNLTDVQMTRRIGRVMLHYGYNALTYVSCQTTRRQKFHFDVCLKLISIWIIRPTISPSYHWTHPWIYPGLSLPFVCQRPVPTPTNSSTNLPWFWDGEEPLVNSETSPATHWSILWWIISLIVQYSSLIIGAALQNGELQQAKVSIMSNLDCKAIETPGKYVTDNTLCITSTFGNRYTYLVSYQQLNYIAPVPTHIVQFSRPETNW